MRASVFTVVKTVIGPSKSLWLTGSDVKTVRKEPTKSTTYKNAFFSKRKLKGKKIINPAPTC